jgi:hypothetical protein
VTYSKSLGYFVLIAVVFVPILALICYPGDTARVEVFSRDIAFRFRVIDAESNRPIPKAMIKLSYRSKYPRGLDEPPKMQLLTSDAEGNVTFVRSDTWGDDFYTRWGRNRTEVDRYWGEVSVAAEGFRPRSNVEIADIRINENGRDPETGTMRFDVPIVLEKQ